MEKVRYDYLDNILLEIKSTYKDEIDTIGYMEKWIKEALNKNIGEFEAKGMNTANYDDVSFIEKDMVLQWSYCVPVEKFNLIDHNDEKVEYVDILVEYVILEKAKPVPADTLVVFSNITIN